MIQIRRNNDFLISSKSRLPSIANEQEIDETVNHKFIDMFPIFPTIDLKDENVYDLNKANLTGQRDHIQTIFHINEDNLSNELDLSRLMMFAFGSAYAQTQVNRNTFEVDSNMRLKTPVVVNAVSVSNQRFNYVVFQLNTLNLSDNNGVKNLVYYDTDENELYLNRPTLDKLPYPTQKNVQRLALRHLEYNPEVFRKFLSIVSFGTNQTPVSTNKQ